MLSLAALTTGLMAFPAHTQSQDTVLENLIVNGTLGIGEENPAAKLHVKGSVIFGEPSLFTRPFTYADANPVIDLHSTSNPYGHIGINFDDEVVGINRANIFLCGEAALNPFGGGCFPDMIPVPVDSLIIKNYTGPIILGTNTRGAAANAFIVNSKGNVGIKEINPQSDLEINGYLKLGLVEDVPPVADCDEEFELGRMVVEPDSGILYICMRSGWIAK